MGEISGCRLITGGASRRAPVSAILSLNTQGGNVAIQRIGKILDGIVQQFQGARKTAGTASTATMRGQGGWGRVSCGALTLALW